MAFFQMKNLPISRCWRFIWLAMSTPPDLWWYAETTTGKLSPVRTRGWYMHLKVQLVNRGSTLLTR